MYSFVYSGVSGRGPAKLISPLSTFHSSGSSSNLNFRMSRPTLVTRGSSSSELCEVGPSAIRILRNFRKVIRPFDLPVRSGE